MPIERETPERATSTEYQAWLDSRPLSRTMTREELVRMRRNLAPRTSDDLPFVFTKRPGQAKQSPEPRP